MNRRLSTWQALLLGLSVMIILAGASFGLVVLANKDGYWQEKFAIRLESSSVDGLREGTKVRMFGVPIGQVQKVTAPSALGQPVSVEFWINKNQSPLVRSNAKARVIKDGLVGERLLDLMPGDPDQPALAEHGTISLEPTISYEDIAKRVDAIVNNVQSGKGTIGRLLNDDSLYQDASNVLKKTDTVTGTVQENLSGLSQNWPLNNMMTDRYQLLIRPEMNTIRNIFAEADLFEPGRAVLTADGTRKLNILVEELRRGDGENAEILIAGFWGDEKDARLADVTTRKQADAVREFLVSNHSIHRTGIFSRRRVTSYGFGNLPAPNGHEKLPARRVEVLMFRRV